jgi:2-phospho-L-lactate guanylyltransferase (CobY/MobA/RfbA family)
MQSLSEDEKRQVLGTVLADQLTAIQEAVKDVPEINSKLANLETALEKVGEDIRIMKAAVTDLSTQVNNHEREIEKLQTI